MTTFFTTSQSAPGPFGAFASGESFVVMPDVALIATAGAAFSGGDLLGGRPSLLVLGTVASNFGTTITASMQAVVTVGTTGTVLAGESGNAIALSAGGRVTNGGWIGLGSALTTVIVTGNFGIVDNSGTIEGRVGVEMSGLGASVTNSGQIVANYSSFSAYGVFVGGSFGAHVANSGLISVQGNTFSAGVELSASSGTVTNTGTILSLQGWGVLCESLFSAGQSMVLTNSGTIQGNLGVTGSILCDEAADRITNTGHLIGDVVLGAGSDMFDTIGGRLTGAVFGGLGDDVFRVDSMLVPIVEAAGGGTDRIESTVDFDLATAAEVENLTLIGNAVTGAGNALGNVLTGNFRDNVLGGAGGNDTMDGGTGNDSLRGDTGNDSVLGGDGDDSLRGASGADTIFGGAGDDTVWGDVLGDRLYGDDGDDVMVGGAGRDFLYGGPDADTFMFRAVADSAAGTASRDIIFVYEPGLDKIDLTRIDANVNVTGNQAFAYIGTGVFTSVAGQLRAVLGTNSLLQADVNGDGVADFELQLNGIATVNVNDILL